MEGIEQRGDDVLLRVRVQPKASRVKVTAEEGRVKVHVTAPPAEGLANRMVCEAVAKWLGIPKSRVQIHSGDRSRDKALLLEEMEVEEVIARLPR
jgi:uncharacterized protein (TIGR00251 family)